MCVFGFKYAREEKKKLQSSDENENSFFYTKIYRAAATSAVTAVVSTFRCMCRRVAFIDAVNS